VKPSAASSSTVHGRFGRLGDIFWVALVTILLWVYADLEFTDTIDMTVTLKLNTGKSENVVILSETEHEITFKITGSRFRIEEFRRELTSRGNELSYNVAGDYGKEKKPRPVSSAELIARAAAANKLDPEGLTVHSAVPDSVQLHVDSIQEIPDVPVKLSYKGAELNAPPQPVKVKVLVPSSSEATVRARLEEPDFALETVQAELGAYQPGEHEIAANVNPMVGDVRLHSVVPQSVTFRITIVNPTQMKPVKVPINIVTPSKWGEKGDTTWKDYMLVISPDSNLRPELQITGPEQHLKPENVRAFVVLTDVDKKPVESWLDREVIVTFAPGTNLRYQGAPIKIKLRLEKRAPAP
jgi:hypothetical protein